MEQAPFPDTQRAAALKAATGDAEAMAEVGRNYMTGEHGFPLDTNKAREAFETSAQKGSAAGLFYVGLLAYSEGDTKKACGLFAQSAGRGHSGGMREYGECQLRGSGGTTKDATAAAESFRRSIANGGIEAYVSLARLYSFGEGVPRDPEEAARLLQRHASLSAGRR